MGNPTDDRVAELERDWPHWHIWTMQGVIGGTEWCARRRDDHKRVLNADTADHLAENLEDQAAAEPVPASQGPQG